jgi:hypothetical protein
VACRARPGRSCSWNLDVHCIDEKNALVCVENRWEPAVCDGRRGCIADAEITNGGISGTCDVHYPPAGQPCEHMGAGGSVRYRCLSDRPAVVECKNHRWQTIVECPGPAKCDREGYDTVCDVGDRRLRTFSDFEGKKE